jgi:hypothetical protein
VRTSSAVPNGVATGIGEDVGDPLDGEPTVHSRAELGDQVRAYDGRVRS